MGLHVTDAFVLRTYKLAEADKIVILLTRQAGLLRGVARGARKMKSRFGASLELFTHITLNYHEKEGRELISLSQAEIIHSYFHLTNNADTVSALAYLSGLLVEFVPPQQPDDNMFRMVEVCLATIETAPDKLSELILYFEIWLLKLSGFLPDIRICTGCRQVLGVLPALFGADNKLQCVRCAQGGGLKLSPDTQLRLLEVLRTAPTTWISAGRTLAIEARQEMGQLTHLLIARALDRPPHAGRHTRRL